MKKRLSKILLLVLVCGLVLCGCESKKKTDTSTDTKKVKSVEDLTQKEGTLDCTRNATVDGGEGEFNYIVKYKGDNLLSIHSVEAIKSDDSSVLKQYEDAYREIDSNYDGIKYYDATVVNMNNTVTHTIDIDYEKIDINKLIELEGLEDNIFEDNQAKLSLYFDLAKKAGVTCKES